MSNVGLISNISCALQPRSLVVFSDDAYCCLHSIAEVEEEYVVWPGRTAERRYNSDGPAQGKGVTAAALAAAGASPTPRTETKETIAVANAAVAELSQAGPTLVRRGEERMSLTFRQSK